jgi:RNA polymerase sigma-70 factor, ECF subfamily
MTGEALFHQVLTSHDAALRRIARAYAGASDETDDLYQDILLQLWRSLPSFRGESAIGTWAYRVALNTALTWRRQARRREQATVTATERTTSGAPRDEVQLLEEVLQTLGPADRSLLLLYMEGLASAAIADVLGVSANVVSVRLHRIKQRLERTYLRD